jgi:hypothetical protein
LIYHIAHEIDEHIPQLMNMTVEMAERALLSVESVVEVR